MQTGWAEPATPFSSTGPQGHRGRMRARLLGAGADSLADYELIEMLLFLGIPRRDTKPLAKALILRFGNLLRTLTAAPDALLAAGLNEPSLRVWALLQEAGARLARAEARSRPLLNTPERVTDYLNPEGRLDRPAHLAVLFLNNRNQLLADEAWSDETEPGACVREVVRRAVHLHATALVLARCRPEGRPRALPSDKAVVEGLRRAGRVLSLVLHEYLVLGRGEPLSFRELRLL